MGFILLIGLMGPLMMGCVVGADCSNDVVGADDVVGVDCSNDIVGADGVDCSNDVVGADGVVDVFNRSLSLVNLTGLRNSVDLTIGSTGLDIDDLFDRIIDGSSTFDATESVGLTCKGSIGLNIGAIGLNIGAVGLEIFGVMVGLMVGVMVGVMGLNMGGLIGLTIGRSAGLTDG
jgi:hypothetical protein